MPRLPYDPFDLLDWIAVVSWLLDAAAALSLYAREAFIRYPR